MGYTLAGTDRCTDRMCINSTLSAFVPVQAVLCHQQDDGDVVVQQSHLAGSHVTSLHKKPVQPCLQAAVMSQRSMRFTMKV